MALIRRVSPPRRHFRPARDPTKLKLRRTPVYPLLAVINTHDCGLVANPLRNIFDPTDYSPQNSVDSVFTNFVVVSHTES